MDDNLSGDEETSAVIFKFSVNCNFACYRSVCVEAEQPCLKTMSVCPSSKRSSRRAVCGILPLPSLLLRAIERRPLVISPRNYKRRSTT